MRASKTIVGLILGLTAMLGAGDLPFVQSSFGPAEGTPAGWRTWSQRPDTMPSVSVESGGDLGEPGALVVAGGGNEAGYGGWERELTGVEAGKWYRFEASYRAQDVKAENWQVVARIDWRGEGDRRRGQPEYAAWANREGQWTRLDSVVRAPEGATSARLQFFLLHAPQGKVWWDAISFKEVSAPGPRKVNVASVKLHPGRTGSKAASLAAFARTIKEKIPAGTDIILLPEAVSLVGSGSNYVDVAAPVPGPDTEFLGKLAREKNAYIVAGLIERVGKAVYNTSVLIDRKGNFVGKYRKVYLPREELEGGVTPGDGYPVFETDFGRVGMMICYDVFFPDPARALAAQGADLLLLPIWDGPERLAVARALENNVFLVVSSYGLPALVLDPNGDEVAKTANNGSVAFATIDLGRSYADEWLGDMRTRRLKEIRADVPLPAPGVLDRDSR